MITWFSEATDQACVKRPSMSLREACSSRFNGLTTGVFSLTASIANNFIVVARQWEQITTA